MRRRLAYRNEHALYSRVCDLSGETFISVFPEKTPFTVYNRNAWWSDQWTALDYGRDFDFSRPFFEQFFELRAKVPRLGVIQQQTMENSDYCNCVANSKNCYLIFSSNYCEDCMYSTHTNNCKNCLDNYNLQTSELCYECTDCYTSYELFFSQECKNCTGSWFLKNCIACDNCFACTNLRHKQYHIGNKPYTKEEYHQKIKEFSLATCDDIENMHKEFESFLQDKPTQYYFGAQNEHISGDYLHNCKNAEFCFECDDIEDCKFCNSIHHATDCYDFTHWGMHSELMYEVQASGYNCRNLIFTNNCWEGNERLTYCDHCHYSKDLFGCVGLKRKEYCIFNKQYTKQDYEALTVRIINHMKQTGEYGEFFPVQQSLFCYNESVAQEQFPLLEEEAKKRGYRWKEKEEREYQPATCVTPRTIDETDDSIVHELLVCTSCNKNYKITSLELSFYKRYGIPVPQQCYLCRHIARLNRRRPRILNDILCSQCRTPLQSTHDLYAKQTVLCERCYNSVIY